MVPNLGSPLGWGPGDPILDDLHLISMEDSFSHRSLLRTPINYPRPTPSLRPTSSPHPLHPQLARCGDLTNAVPMT